MNKDIKYLGYSSTPSDYESVDGELAMSMNLINEDDQLKPIYQPKQVLSLRDEGDRVVCIHKTTEFTHYIVQNYDGLIYWIDSESPTTYHILGTNQFTGLTKVTAIGNTLCVLCEAGMYYFLWTENDLYKYLGTEIPELMLSFGLQCKIQGSETGIFALPNGAGDVDEVTYTLNETTYRIQFPNDGVAEDNSDEITEYVLAKVNELIANITEEGRFSMPFFVRYALRLYDGSLTHQSAPILMLPTSGTSPVVLCMFAANGRCSFNATAPACLLDMKSITNPSDLVDWKDLIQSVDIFVSAPIYKYDQSGKIDSFSKGLREEATGFFSLQEINSIVNTDTMLQTLKKYNQWNIADAINVGYRANPRAYAIPILPTKDEDTYLNDIRSCSTFYLVKSIPVDEISQTRSVIDISGDVLQTLQVREVMTDDYDSHEKLKPSNAFHYNSRLILSGLKKELFGGYLNAPFTETLLTNIYTIGHVAHATDSSSSCFVVQRVYTYIKRNNRTYIVRENLQSNIILSALYTQSGLFVPYAYHPDAGAYKMEIYYSYMSQIRKVVLDLKPHDFLNGAFYFGAFENQSVVFPAVYPSVSADTTIDIANKIYTSEVNNPFFFPVGGIVSVGTGEVIGVSTAAKALSQGQFGQFPLYAFTTDGVWALSIGNNGMFSASQPITRDVCINADSITQIDDTVLFATDRGIMLLSGSEHKCVSDQIFGEYPFDVSSLTGMSTLHSLLGHGSDSCMPTQPFLTFIKDCQMVYDYVHQRVVVFNPSLTYAYVLSVKSGRWGMMFSSLLASTNSYPDAMATSHDGKLVSFSDTDETKSKGMFVTRPITMGDGAVAKSVHTLVQRGYHEKGDVCVVLYGSNDLFNWHLVGSSTTNAIRNLRGTPYRYFRVAGVSTLSGGKSLNGASFDIAPRHLNVTH